MSSLLSELANEFRSASEDLKDYKARTFRSGGIVMVLDTKEYALCAEPWDGCPPDMLALRFESGNIWYRNIEACCRVDAKAAPRWARRMMLRWHGYKLL